MKVLVLDNYDSFTYNLVAMLKHQSITEIDVTKNDKISLVEVAHYDKILLSPGPGLPHKAGIMNDLLRTYASSKSIFGVCLGLQAIGEVFGAKLINLQTSYHGLATEIKIINQDDLFSNCPNKFNVGRYHSWAIENNNVPDDLIVTSVDDENCIMSIKHKQYDIRAVQFHPESILSEYGQQIIDNWLSI